MKDYKISEIGRVWILVLTISMGFASFFGHLTGRIVQYGTPPFWHSVKDSLLFSAQMMGYVLLLALAFTIFRIIRLYYNNKTQN